MKETDVAFFVEQYELTKEIVDSADLVVAMAENHKKFIYNNFGIDVPLFNEICFGELSSVFDVEDIFPNEPRPQEPLAKFVKKQVCYIHDSIPSLIKNLDNWKK